MYSNLPTEVLEQIFTHPNITKKDLLQLQLTCKRWSSVAQRHLYKEIKLYDCGEQKNKEDHESATRRTLALLMRTLLLLNRKIGKFVKTINFGFLLTDNTVPEDLLLNVAMLAHLCPNVVDLGWYRASNEFLETLTNLHRQGKLQHLEVINTPYNPEIGASILTKEYHTAIIEFRDTLKKIAVVDGVSNTTSTQCVITPDSLQLFSRLEHLQVFVYSRVHLYQLRDYISNCRLTVKSLSINMRGTAILPPATADHDQSVVHPQEHIRHLSLCLDTSIITDEMSFVMRMFPSLDNIFLEVTEGEEGAVLHRYDMQVVALFLQYLLLIPQVHYTMRFGAAQGLACISRLVNTMETKSLTLFFSTAGHDDTELVLRSGEEEEDWTKEFSNKTTATKSNVFNVSFTMPTTEVQASLNNVLEGYNGRVMESFCIVCESLGKLTQQWVDSILDINTQRLVFDCAVFPSQAPRSETRKLKHLAYLGLFFCNITENYFTWLSCQFQQIDHLELSYRPTDKVIRIPLLYTTLGKLSLEADFDDIPFVIRVWVNCKYITLKLTLSEQTSNISLEEYEETESLTDGYEVIVYCADLEEIYCEGASYKLP